MTVDYCSSVISWGKASNVAEMFVPVFLLGKHLAEMFVPAFLLWKNWAPRENPTSDFQLKIRYSDISWKKQDGNMFSKYGYLFCTNVRFFAAFLDRVDGLLHFPPVKAGSSIHDATARATGCNNLWREPIRNPHPPNTPFYWFAPTVARKVT